MPEWKDFKTRYLIMFYLFPIVCEKTSEFELLYHPRNAGIYIGDTNKPEWENKIVVAFKICAPPKFKEFYNNNKYKYSKYYEDIDGELYEIFAFHIPPKYKNDVANILNNNFKGVSAPFRSHVDWISFPMNSYDYFNNLDCLHQKLWKIDKSGIQLNLNGVSTTKGIQ